MLADGTVESTIELDPFGGETTRSVNSAFQPHKYTSYECDGNTTDDAMNRRYHVWWSRMDQADPYDGSYNATDPQSFNRYSYVQNDPVNFVDPSGLRPQICGLFNMGDGQSGFVCFGDWLPFYGWDPPDRRASDPADPSPTPDEIKPQDTYEKCKGKLAPGVPVPGKEQAKLISRGARAEGIDPNLLAVTVSAEDQVWFTGGPSINGPHGGGTADIGPGQLDYAGLNGWSDLNGLQNIWGTNLGVGQTFNGNEQSNLQAAARYIQHLGGGREGTIHYHSGKGPFSKKPAGREAIRARGREFDARAQSYKDFFDCLRSDPFGFF